MYLYTIIGSIIECVRVSFFHIEYAREWYGNRTRCGGLKSWSGACKAKRYFTMQLQLDVDRFHFQ